MIVTPLTEGNKGLWALFFSCPHLPTPRTPFQESKKALNVLAVVAWWVKLA